MLLVIHAGLHKTASTYFQHVLLRNREALLRAGLYVQPEANLGANHSTAWAARIGDFTGIREHMKLAMATGRKRMILSSEDFESLIFTPGNARGVEQAARAGGATEIEWHFCLRDPGAYFASQYAQLARHTFVDFLAMYESVMREGRFDVASEERRHPDEWSHCFDYTTHLGELSHHLGGTLVFHDFRDSQPFPGHAILDRLTGASVPLALPEDKLRNSRNSADSVEAEYRARLNRVLDVEGISEATRNSLIGRAKLPPGVLAELSAAVSRRYAPGMERLLAQKQMKGGA